MKKQKKSTKSTNSKKENGLKLQKKSRRSKDKYAALKPELNLKSRAECLDYDYLDKLSPKEKEWLANFTDEWVGANLQHKGKKFHKTKEEKKMCFDRNNARNRDLYTAGRTTGWLSLLDVEKVDFKIRAEYSDAMESMAGLVDAKKELKKP